MGTNTLGRGVASTKTDLFPLPLGEGLAPALPVARTHRRAPLRFDNDYAHDGIFLVDRPTIVLQAVAVCAKIEGGDMGLMRAKEWVRTHSFVF